MRRPKADRADLIRQAQRYVERWYTPSASLRAALRRRVDRSLAVHGGDREALYAIADEVVAELVRAGAVDDRRWAEDKARSLLERGVAIRAIRERLRAKRVDSAAIAHALSVVQEELEGADPDWQAAVAYARRRRLGPFRRDPSTRAERARKDLAALARAGHSYGHARRIIDAESPEALDAE